MEETMTFHIRVRPSALIVFEKSILLVQYQTEESGIYYYLPGGGSEPGETIKETLKF